MRDDHYRDHIVSGPQEIPHAENLEPDEIQPLLFDLVRAGKTEAVRNLLRQFEALPREIKEAIRECAASFGSTAIIDLIDPFNKDHFPMTTLQSSIRAGKIDLFNHVLSRSKNCGKASCLYSQTIVKEVLRSDSEEAFESLVSYLQNTGLNKFFHEIVTSAEVIRATAGHPERENLLIVIWEKTGVPKLGDRILSTAVINVASTTRSVKLAEYLVGHGAKVDIPRSKLNRSVTALQHAARQDSAAAAEIMKYLLLQGADPELKAGRSRLRIRDEKGAKGIAKWLGMSWDELVAKTKEEREKIASKSMKSVG